MGQRIVALRLAMSCLSLYLILFDLPCYAVLITVSGNPAPLVINSATAGQAPTAVIDSSTTYTIVNVLSNTILGSVNSNLPAGTQLRVSLAAPSGATSQGIVTLTTTPQTLVSNVPIGTYLNLAITYYFSATSAAGLVALTSRTVTLTLSP